VRAPRLDIYFATVVIFLFCHNLPASGQIALDPFVIASGGGVANSNSHMMKVTIGQYITGKTGGGSYFSRLGFWEQLGYETAIAVPEQPPVFATSLHQNTPNPFNPSTMIRFSLAETQRVIIDVFDLQGRRIARILDDSLPPGEHSQLFRPVSLSSGIYLLRLRAGNYQESRRLVLLK
jgi:hypothetical protein